MHPARLLRNRLLGASRRIAAPVVRWHDQRVPAEVQLVTVQRRLELLLGAMYGRPMRVVASGGGAGGVGEPGPADVVLPPSIPGEAEAHERYRLLAIQQGARIVRGTREAVPSDALERDLYLMLEGAAVDAALAQRAPGLCAAIGRLRLDELARRPSLLRLLPQQREVELSVRAQLGSAADAAAASLPRTLSAVESAALARTMARRMRETRLRGSYRPLPAVSLWSDDVMRWRERMPWASLADIDLERTGLVESDEAPVRQVASPSGTTAMDAPESDTGDADPTAGQGEPGSGGQEQAPDEGARAAASAATDDSTTAVTGGVPYPEWIERHGRLEPRHVRVHAAVVPERDDAWARGALLEHGALVRQVRDRFALLRARRVRLRAQRAGDELDLDACVAALIDLHLNRAPGDRLYQTTRETRHALAIAILVDVSGSTKTVLPDGRTILDVERLSLLLASEALGALGDPFAIFAFSGLGRHDVRVATVKGFSEHDTAALHRRISSLEPQDNTRLGAAVRHTTALLAAQPSARRVLLMLSDGRPNDVDRYQGIDAIADSRQALLAARAAGVHTFCLTVDAEEADYLPHLFGDTGYRVITRPAQLPAALIHLVDRLLRG
jgi:nitric oxide reductase NorD protein